jgi:hypothetical protein
MMILQANVLFAFVCAFTFFGAGKAEAKNGGSDHSLLWSALSAITSAVLIKFFGAGAILVLVGQAALFIAIGIFRAMNDR